MTKSFKIFKIVTGYRPQNMAYYDSTPHQLDDVTFSIAEKHSYKTEASAVVDLDKSPKFGGGEFLILPVYTK